MMIPSESFDVKFDETQNANESENYSRLQNLLYALLRKNQQITFTYRQTFAKK